MNDYNGLKNEVKFLKEKVSMLDVENNNIRIQNQSLQKNAEKLRESLVDESSKFEKLKIEVSEKKFLIIYLL